MASTVNRWKADANRAGMSCPAFHPHRLNEQDFDTLGDRPPTDGYSVWARIFALIFFIVVVSVVSYLRRQ